MARFGISGAEYSYSAVSVRLLVKCKHFQIQIM